MPSLKVSEKSLTTCTDKDICLQWYQPALYGISEDSETKIVLLYAVGKPPPKAASKSAGKSPYIISNLVLPLSELTDLHDNLAVLRQRADMSLSEKPKSAATLAGTPSGVGSVGLGSPSGSNRTGSRKSRRTARIAQLSAKVKKDENLEVCHICISKAINIPSVFLFFFNFQETVGGSYKKD